MKKTIAMLLALVMIMGMCMSLSACSNKKDYVGIWDIAGSGAHMYIFEDGTGDYGNNCNPFVWEIEDGYIVLTECVGGSTHVSKYTLSGSLLLDNRGKLYATKYSSDPCVDVPRE